MRILVTGGTGTLGRAVVPKLAAAGHTVRVMTRRPGAAGGAESVEADLATGAGIGEAVSGIEVVVHLASAPYRGRYTVRVEVDGTGRLLTAASQAGVRHLLFISIVGVDRVPWGYFRRKLAAELRSARDTAEAAADLTPLETIHSVIRALVTYRGADPRLAAAIRAEARPGTQLAAGYDQQHRQVADLLVAVALRLGSPLPEPTIRLAALLLVNGVVDLGPELRQRRDALDELSTIACLAFGLPAQ